MKFKAKFKEKLKANLLGGWCAIIASQNCKCDTPNMPNLKRNAASQVGNTGKTHGKCGDVPNFIAYFGHF